MTVSRRTFLAASAAGSALALVRPAGALDLPLGLGTPALEGASRQSRLFPAGRLVHGDLHNHTVRSDGAGDPAAAFASMRSAGLDFAALTDHATVGKAAGTGSCVGGDCSVLGIDEATWAEAGRLADAAQDDGAFTAVRGFEWSSPALGHVNVWFGRTWTDPLSTAGIGPEGIGQLAHDNGVPLTAEQAAQVDAVLRATPADGADMRLFQEWLARPADTPVVGGGADAVAGFNHPGRETGRFGDFVFDERLGARMVSLEVFNRGEDYLFEGTTSGAVSPLHQCLEAGWTPGLVGVTDEHGTAWGTPENAGRTGMYVEALTRAGVRGAMERRAFFASRLRGLRLDASADGVRMGGRLAHTTGPLRIALDLDRGPSWYGRPVNVQVLQAARAGELLPRVVKALTVTVPTPDEPVVAFDVDVSAADGRWLIVRVSDPASTTAPGDLRPGDRSIAEDSRAKGTAFAGLGPAIAYASPFYLGAPTVADADAVPAVAHSH
ncbi:MAG: Gamma-glutamyltranspeptidase [Frankiales bacterium]|nr:Gamma-glutamyltranspeptidase [Frankiales bacterium]